MNARNQRRHPLIPILLLQSMLVILPAVSPARAADTFSMDDYGRVEKIDVHVHLRTLDPGFVERAKHDRFRFLTIAVHSPDPAEMRLRHETAFAQLKAHPDRVAVASAFPMAGWDQPDWQEKTIQYLDATFKKGAIAVKVWKNIGMEFRDKQGRLVMIDDPRFDPIFDHLASRGIRLIGHLGEPKNCWLPLDRMTVKNDRRYFKNHPEYHMYLHPDMPSYQEQIGARDRMLAKHPNLTFIAAHLASLEWNVDAIARFLDRFPNALVDTAARMGHLQYQSHQDRDRVRRFLLQYQDRIVYGTDLGLAPTSDPEASLGYARRRWQADWRYLTTGDELHVPALDEPVRGLELPRTVVEKIYRINARRVFPNAWTP